MGSLLANSGIHALCIYTYIICLGCRSSKTKGSMLGECLYEKASQKLFWSKSKETTVFGYPCQSMVFGLCRLRFVLELSLLLFVARRFRKKFSTRTSTITT